MHRIYLTDADPEPGTLLTVTGPEAHHAVRVKRLDEGERLELLDGRGLRATGEVREIVKQPPQTRGGKAEWAVRIGILGIERETPISPRVWVLASAPKGPRLEGLIDQLSQVGAAGWSPLVTTRTIVSPREGKMLKAERVATEAAKQCGRAWTMQIGEPVHLDEAFRREGARVVIADASGEPYEADGSAEITLLVGPEGGFSEAELEAARHAGALVCRFGVHVMRVETAAVVGAGVMLDAETRRSGR